MVAEPAGRHSGHSAWRFGPHLRRAWGSAPPRRKPRRSLPGPPSELKGKLRLCRGRGGRGPGAAREPRWRPGPPARPPAVPRTRPRGPKSRPLSASHLHPQPARGLAARDHPHHPVELQPPAPRRVQPRARPTPLRGPEAARLPPARPPARSRATGTAPGAPFPSPGRPRPARATHRPCSLPGLPGPRGRRLVLGARGGDWRRLRGPGAHPASPPRPPRLPARQVNTGPAPLSPELRPAGRPGARGRSLGLRGASEMRPEVPGHLTWPAPRRAAVVRLSLLPWRRGGGGDPDAESGNPGPAAAPQVRVSCVRGAGGARLVRPRPRDPQEGAAWTLLTWPPGRGPVRGVFPRLSPGP